LSSDIHRFAGQNSIICVSEPGSMPVSNKNLLPDPEKNGFIRVQSPTLHPFFLTYNL
jgi:hypothetical protein